MPATELGRDLRLGDDDVTGLARLEQESAQPQRLRHLAERLSPAREMMVRTRPGQGLTVFDRDGAPIGPLEKLAAWLCFERDKGELAQAVHEVEDEEAVQSLVYRSPRLDDEGYYLRREETGELQHLFGVIVHAQIKVWQSEVSLRGLVLGDESLAAAQAKMFGADAVWVASPADDGGSRVSWTSVDPKAVEATLRQLSDMWAEEAEELHGADDTPGDRRD